MSHLRGIVIASEAKQSSFRDGGESWIASSLTLLAMTAGGSTFNRL
jgi:hypothetical protein